MNAQCSLRTSWRLRWVVAVCTALAPPIADVAQAELTVIENAEGQQGLTVFKMTVTPAAAPQPAFAHRLLPGPLEIRPGNAALFYLRAVLGAGGFSNSWKEVEEQWADDKTADGEAAPAWHSAVRPLGELPLEKARASAARFDVIVAQLIARGTVREDCDWGRHIDELEGLEIISVLLPDVQEMRQLARMLMLRTRVAVADGDYERAIEQLRMNYRLGQNVGSDPILVCGLVGIAIASLGNGELPELIAAKDSPNLYWALAELPRPLVDLHPAVRFELNWGARIFPVLMDPEEQRHAPEEWARLIAKSLQDMQAAGAGQVWNDWTAKFGALGLGLLAYPEAKARLIAGGMSADDVNSMPVGQVVAVDASREYRRIAQEFEKWWYAPFAEARQRNAGHDAMAEELIGDRLEGGYGRILAALMMPALVKVREAQTRLDWHLDALQTVEAIRMHAAETGKLPASLADVTIVPVPKNPATGELFQYRLDGESATLDLPFSDGFTNVAYRYEITLAKE